MISKVEIKNENILIKENFKHINTLDSEYTDLILKICDAVESKVLESVTCNKKGSVCLTSKDFNGLKKPIEIQVGYLFLDETEILLPIYVDKKEHIIFDSKAKKNIIQKVKQDYITDGYEDTDGTWIEPKDEKNMPIYIHYGDNCIMNEISILPTQESENVKLDAFKNVLNKKLSSKDLYSWIRYEEDYENSERIYNDFQYRNNSLLLVKYAMLYGLGKGSSIRIKRNPLSLMVNENDVYMDIEKFSCKEKEMMSLFGDIARRIILTQPRIRSLAEGRGLVIIEHSKDNVIIKDMLTRYFPSLDFIFV
jgi:hypothetical protein